MIKLELLKKLRQEEILTKEERNYLIMLVELDIIREKEKE